MANTLRIINFFIFLFLVVFGWRATNAQLVNFEWVKQSIGTQTSTNASAGITSVKVDALGNVFTAGTYSGVTDFDPGPGVFNLTAHVHPVTGRSNGVTNVYISKRDSLGNYLWVKSWGDTVLYPGSSTTFVDMAIDGSRNIYITGIVEGVADMDPGQGTYFLEPRPPFVRQKRVYVVKLDASGNFIWANQISYEASGSPKVYSLAVDHAANVYITGWTPDDLIFGTTTIDARNAFIAKLSSAGNWEWAKSYPKTYDIAVDVSGNLYVTGMIEYSVDMDPGTAVTTLAPLAGSDAFVSKINPGGNLVWARRMGSKGADHGIQVALNAAGDVYVSGSYEDTAHFGAGLLLTEGGQFVTKLNAAGDFIYANSLKVMGSSLELGDRFFSLAVDAAGNAYTTGQFEDTVDFDPGVGIFKMTAANFPDTFIIPNFPPIYETIRNKDAFICKWNPAGNFVWAVDFGTVNRSSNRVMSFGCLGLDITVDGLGNVYSAGSFEDTIDFDPGISVVAEVPVKDNYAFYLHKMSQDCITDSAISVTACSSYVFNGQTYTATGTYTFPYINAAGCDSFVKLNLTINNSAATIIQTVCDSLVLNGHTFKTTGVYTQHFTNSKQCDSTLTLNLTVNKSTGSSITEIACDSFVLNGQIYTTSGIHKQTFSNAANCDSVVELNLIIKNHTKHTVVQAACDSFTLNGISYYTSGVYHQSYNNAAGCDSLLILELTVSTAPDASVTQEGSTLTADESDAIYQWIDCNNGNAAISGATSRSYTPATTGKYAVVVSGDNCSDTSFCFNVEGIGTGINEIGLQSKLSIYPNPVSGMITIITTDAFHNATIRLVNAIGQVLLTKTEIQGYEKVLDLSFYASGIYFIEVLDGHDKARVKIIKE